MTIKGKPFGPHVETLMVTMTGNHQLVVCQWHGYFLYPEPPA